MILNELTIKLMNGAITIQNYLDGSQKQIYEYVICGIHFVFENLMKG